MDHSFDHLDGWRSAPKAVLPMEVTNCHLEGQVQVGSKLGVEHVLTLITPSGSTPSWATAGAIQRHPSDHDQGVHKSDAT